MVQEDWDGTWQAAGVTTFALKEIIPEVRPDGSNDKSFPSGQSSISFAAAASLDNRYGWKAGVPAFAVAASPVWPACKPTSTIGMTYWLVPHWELLITHKQDDHVQLVPWIEEGGGGLALSARF